MGSLRGTESGGARGTLLTRHRGVSVLGSGDAGHHLGPRQWEKLLEKLDGAQGEPKEGIMRTPRQAWKTSPGRVTGSF